MRSSKPIRKHGRKQAQSLGTLERKTYPFSITPSQYHPCHLSLWHNYSPLIPYHFSTFPRPILAPLTPALPLIDIPFDHSLLLHIFFMHMSRRDGSSFKLSNNMDWIVVAKNALRNKEEIVSLSLFNYGDVSVLIKFKGILLFPYYQSEKEEGFDNSHDRFKSKC